MSDSTADWSVMTQAQKDAALRSARAQGMREAAEMVEGLAPVLDHPSVYMGGPSRAAQRNAKYIADDLRTRADAIERGE